MKKFVEISHQCKDEYSGCIQVSDAPSLHLCLKNPNQCFWVYDAGRHDVNLGAYPTTSINSAIERASLAEFVGDSIAPSHFRSQESTIRELASLQRFVKAGHENGFLISRDTVQLNDIIAQMKQAQTKSNPAFDYDLIPIVMAALTLQDDIASKALQFSILTSARLSDLVRLKWTNMDIEAGGIQFNFGLHAQNLTPLSGSALKLLEGIPATGDHIFSTDGVAPISTNQLHSTAKKIGVKISSTKIRAAFRAWVLTNTGSDSQLMKIDEPGYLHQLKKGGHNYTIESLQTPEAMAAWSGFCYSRC